MRTDQLQWLTPDGELLPLTQQPDLEVHWALGVEGRFMPPVRLSEDDVYLQDGSRLRQVKYGPRDVTLPLTVIGADETQVRTKIRQVLRAFDPTRGDGTLRATAPDGTQREVTCRYVEGLQGSEDRSSMGEVFQRMVLVLHATDPFWSDTVPTARTFTVGDASPMLSSQFLPVNLTSDNVLGQQQILNDGDLLAYPVLTVRGPATTVTLTNGTTGEVIAYQAPIADGEVVVFDTRPFRKSVRRADGTNLFQNLSTSSTLWALPQGMSLITLDLPGSNEGSFATLSYRRQWLSP